MKIYIYGECEVYGSGAWCYFQTLNDLGHQVSFFSPFEKLHKYDTLLMRAVRRLNDGKVLSWDRNAHVQSLLRSIKGAKPDIFIVLKGLMIGRELVEEIKSLGVWVVLINHDDFFSAYKNSRSVIQLDAVPVYDYVFPTKEINVLELRSKNPKIEFFPFAYYEKIHRPPKAECAREKEVWKSDIVFIGSRYPERAKQLEFLARNIRPNTGLKVYGNGWNRTPRNSPLFKFVKNRTLGPEDMCRAIFYSKIALGFLCKENRDDYTQRTFEIPAARGLLLAERTKRHLSFYKEGLEAEFFDAENYEELVSKVLFLLSNREHREGVRDGGHVAVTSGQHTYADRLTRLLEIYQSEHR